MTPAKLFAIIMILLMFGIFAWAILSIARAQAMYRFSNLVLDRIRFAANTDIQQNLDWTWRYRAFDQLDLFHTGCKKFWKRPENLIQDKAFMYPGPNPNATMEFPPEAPREVQWL